MRKVLIICLLLLCILQAKAQFFGYPQVERSLELFSEPIMGINNLYVGDEGYVIFQIINRGNHQYRGPIFIRIFEREHSYQILVEGNVKLNPGRVYEFTAVFPTDRLAPFVRYLLGFEYVENKHLIHMNPFRNRPMPFLILHAPIVSKPSAKAAVRPGSRRLRGSVTKRATFPADVAPTRQNQTERSATPNRQPRNGDQYLNGSGNSVRNNPPNGQDSQRTRQINTPVPSGR